LLTAAHGATVELSYSQIFGSMGSGSGGYGSGADPSDSWMT